MQGVVRRGKHGYLLWRDNYVSVVNICHSLGSCHHWLRFGDKTPSPGNQKANSRMGENSPQI